MTRIAIAPLPVTWCPSCLESWQPDMVAVKMASTTVCGACVLEAVRLVVAEQERRDEERAAVRGDVTNLDAA